MSSSGIKAFDIRGFFGGQKAAVVVPGKPVKKSTKKEEGEQIFLPQLGCRLQPLGDTTTDAPFM
jgi:hypothetical protein